MSSASPTPRRTGTIAAVAVVVLLAASAVLYWVLIGLQRGVFLNGVPAADPHVFPRPVTDVVALLSAQSQYLPLAAAVLLAYVVVLLLVRWTRGRAVGRIAVIAGVLGQLALLPTSPTLSIDLYSYVAHGYLAATPGSNPYTMAAASVADSPLGPSLFAQGWTAVHPQTPYGPLWTHAERLLVAFAANDVPRAALLLKAVVVVATIGTGLLAWAIAARVRPGAGPLAASAWLLNPVVVIEFGAEGHNDAVAIFFVALALLAALQGWALVAVLAIAGGTLVKWLPAAFAVPVLVWLFRQARSKRRVLVEVTVGVVAAVAGTWWLWAPWWAGLDTFDGLRASATPNPSPSPAGWLAQVLFDPLALEPSILPSLAMVGALLVVAVAASWGGRPSSWLAGCAVVAVAALAISPLYWPWYTALPIAVLAMRPTAVALCQVVVLTAGSRFVALWGDLGALGQKSYEQIFSESPLYGITWPVAACVVLGLIGAAVHAVRRLIASRGGRTGEMRSPAAAPQA